MEMAAAGWSGEEGVMPELCGGAQEARLVHHSHLAG